MIKYTIYTENKNLKEIEVILSLNIKGYTLISCLGYWKGEKERSLKIEIIESESINYIIRAICIAIQTLNKQEAVLFTVENVEGIFI